MRVLFTAAQIAARVEALAAEIARTRCSFSAISQSGLAGRPVLLVDDIVDTGRSIAYAAAELHRCGIRELWICALIDKPQRRQIEIAIDFVGFSVPDLFVVGYGTDYAEKYRHLPYIGAIE